MKMIDAHVHAAIGNRKFPEDFPVEDLIGRMDAAGVEKAVVVQSKLRNGMDSDYPAEAVKRYPKRLVAVSGSVLAAPEAVSKLRHRIEVWGARGVRIFWDSSNLNEPGFDAYWRTAAALGIPVLIAGEARYPELGALAARFPELKLVLDHLGNPDFAKGFPAGILDLAGHPSISVKFSTHTIAEAGEHGLAPQQVLDRTVAAFGADRMMWGSNYPASHEPEWPYQATIDVAKAMTAGYRAEERRRILFGTAARLWPELAG